MAGCRCEFEGRIRHINDYIRHCIHEGASRGVYVWHDVQPPCRKACIQNLEKKGLSEMNLFQPKNFRISGGRTGINSLLLFSHTVICNKLKVVSITSVPRGKAGTGQTIVLSVDKRRFPAFSSYETRMCGE